MAAQMRSIVVAFTAVLLVVLVLVDGVTGNAVFRVENKFKLTRKNRTVREMRAHDIQRHGRFLSTVDMYLGGDGRASASQLYYAKIGLGTPPKHFYVQIDTGSEICWLNCADCDSCAKRTNILEKVSFFDPKKSNTSKPVRCDDPICAETNSNRDFPGCKSDAHCPYESRYLDGSGTTGFLLSDYIQLSQVTGTEAFREKVAFGCGNIATGTLNSTHADDTIVDGLFGFGNGNSSLLSQLVATGKIKKKFAHCFNAEDGGGGIFAVGDVVLPPSFRTTRLVPNVNSYYQVRLKSIDVDGEKLQLPDDLFDIRTGTYTILDTGTTSAWVPDAVYQKIMAKIQERQPQVKIHHEEAVDEDGNVCFDYIENIDDKFPVVTFHMKNFISLTVYPHDYLYLQDGGKYCIGWANSGNNENDREKMITILGDLALQNKMFVFDLESMRVGWAEYDCKSSNIKVKDEKSGAEYSVGSHDVSSAFSLASGRIYSSLVLLLLVVLLQSSNLH